MGVPRRLGDPVDTAVNHEDRIRRLELRPTSAQIDDWKTLQAHLPPGWANPVNTSVSDLSDPWCPRYYVDRDRAYLGGAVLLSRADLGGFADYILLDGLPADILPTRQIDLGLVAEDMYWSNLGWLPHTGIVAIDPASLRIVTGGDDDPIDDEVVISLEPFSWRIT